MKKNEKLIIAALIIALVMVFSIGYSVGLAHNPHAGYTCELMEE